MENSRIGNRLAAALCTALLLCGCRQFTEHPAVVLPAAVQEVLADTASASFIDFSSYGELRSLPIGIFDADSTSMTLLETFTGLDLFDNITGARRSDGLADFAGEHFQYYTAKSDDDCFGSGLFLMQDRYWDSFAKERSKIVVAGGFLSPSGGLDNLEILAEHNAAGVKVISEVNAGMRAMFDSLANDNISAFTIASLSDSSHNALKSYSEMVRKISAEQGKSRTISIINSQASPDGLAKIVEDLRRNGSKSPLKVIVMSGLEDEFKTSCTLLLERYRSMFVNGTYPYRSILADDIIFIDPALCAAAECYVTLRNDRNLALRAERQKVSYFYGL